MEKVLLLLSGGLDSATAGIQYVKRVCPDAQFHSLTFDYGQRHRIEIECAENVSKFLGCVSRTEYRLNRFSKSALTTDEIEVPKDRDAATMSESIPATYVPARNIVFLAIAAGFAEDLGARMIVTGFNELDYSGYPDCRKEFVTAFEHALNLGTKIGIEKGISIRTPLITMKKKDIILLGDTLGMDYSLTHSCYDPIAWTSGANDYRACGKCDSCILRRKGFEEAKVNDPTKYAEVL